MTFRRCNKWDYALRAQASLRPPNKVICTCVHCRVQGETEEGLIHKTTCCFFGDKGSEIDQSDTTIRLDKTETSVPALSLAVSSSEIAEARYEMFTEAADHLDNSVTDNPLEQREIAFVQEVIRAEATRWLKLARMTGRGFHTLRSVSHGTYRFHCRACDKYFRREPKAMTCTSKERANAKGH